MTEFISKMKRTIIIMTKVPQAGEVKTRLQPFLTARQSAEISVCFLQDAEQKAKSVIQNLVIAFSPFEKKNLLVDILQSNPILIEQTGENLGERMLHAFEFAFSQNSDAVVMIGTDSPTFPAEFIGQAFMFLEMKADVVLGKTVDGGFYLIGLRKAEKEIFQNVEWSSPKTFRQTKRNIENMNLVLKEIPVWYDVDVPKDLERLKKELTTNPRIAPKTTEFLESLTISANPSA
jgi:rSAM/selenodomain-associated transferase 1